MKGLMMMLVLAFALPLQAAPCEDGTSAGYACSHVEFVAHLSPADMGGDGEVLNDIWGWVDPLDGNEYALVGMEDGTAFVRLEDDGTAVFLGRLPASDGASSIAKTGSGHAHKSCHDEACGSDSAWRDIKVYSNADTGQHFAFIVSEAEGHGVQVFDLAALRGVSSPQTFAIDGSAAYYRHYAGVGHAHNIFINNDTRRAYVVGHDGGTKAGGLHILDITNPLNPTFVGEVNKDGYTHDVQCVVYTGPDPDIAPNSEICFASNEDTLTIWDVTKGKAANALMLSRTGYSGALYTHQGWLSDDQEYFFLNDELDERNRNTRTHLRVFDVSDLAAPRLVANYLAPTLAIDHNNYVHGRWLLQSNYNAGLRILDIRDPLHPVEAGYFDPQASDTAEFHGNWSNYQFPSGLVAMSDINDGLFVVRPRITQGGIAPDLAVTLVADASEATTDETVNGTLTVAVGAAADATDTLLTLHLPRDAAFASLVAPAGWDCDSFDDARVQKCRADTLEADSEHAFTFTLGSSVAGAVEFVAMAYADSADAEPADNLDVVGVSFKNTTPANGGGGSGGGALAWLLPVFLVVVFRRAVRRKTG